MGQMSEDVSLLEGAWVHWKGPPTSPNPAALIVEG